MTTAIIVPKEAQPIRDSVERFLAEAAKIEVVDQESSSAAQRVIFGIKEGIKRWKELWKPHRDRAAALLNGLRADEAEIVDKADPVRKILEAKVVAWTLAERKKAEAADEARKKVEWEARQAEEEAKKKARPGMNFEDFQPPPKVELPPVAVKPRVEPEGQMRDHWTWELEDFEKVPRRFLKLDDGEITRHVQANHDQSPIPGIKVMNKPILAQSRRQI